MEQLRFLLYNVTAMKQEQQIHYTANEAAYQVVMTLDLGIKIPQDDSVRVLMRIAERIDWRKLSGAYERENSSWEATPKQMFLLIVLGFMNRLYSTRAIERACRCDIRFMWLLAGRQAPDHTRLARFIKRIEGGIMEDLFYQMVHILKEDGEIEYGHLFVDGTKVEANANRFFMYYHALCLVSCSALGDLTIYKGLLHFSLVQQPLRDSPVLYLFPIFASFYLIHRFATPRHKNSDRWPRKNVTIFSQSCFTSEAFVL